MKSPRTLAEQIVLKLASLDVVLGGDEFCFVCHEEDGHEVDCPLVASRHYAQHLAKTTA